MRGILSILTLVTLLLLAMSVIAADKVVVVPLGSAVGDATVEDVIKGKTFSSKDGKGLTGTMPDVGRQDITPSDTEQQITEGYHDGTGVVEGDADLTETNVRHGVELFGIAGTLKMIVCEDVDNHCHQVAGNQCSYDKEGCCMEEYGKTCANTFSDCKDWLPGGELPCLILGICNGYSYACNRIGNKLSN